MIVICVDDEPKALSSSLALCREQPGISGAEGFARGSDALAWLDSHSADLALLDVNMPDMDGITLARWIRAKDPEIAVVFLTAHPEHALEAWAVHPSGYLLKPLTREKLEEELRHLRSGGYGRARSRRPRVEVQTFGNFDLFVGGSKVYFSRAKAKELLAWLIDRRGIRVSRGEAFRLLWEEEEYTRPKQKMLDVIIRSLRSTLNEYGAGEILQLEQGMLRIVPEAVDCDLYRFFAGEPGAADRFQGEYMSSYSWARETEGRISSELAERRAAQARTVRNA